MKNQQRLTILTPEEIQFLYELPIFSDVERRHYFSLPEPILQQLKLKDFNHNRTSSKLYFILQYGYFKAKNLLFNFRYNNVIDDATFIMQQYLSNDKLPKKLPTPKQRAKIKHAILEFFGFKNKAKKTRELILNKIKTLVKSTQDPSIICFEVVNFLREHKIVLPSYSSLQDIIGAGMKNEEKRLINMTKRHLTKKIRKAINNLFNTDDAFYKITELKFDPKFFKKREMETEIKKLATCDLIYEFSKIFLPKANISRKNITYYSELARIYSVDSLKSIKKGLSYFYLICYINQRCENIINNLIKGFIYYVDKYVNSAKKYAKNNIIEISSDLDKHKKSIGRLMKLYTDDEIMKLSGKKIRKEAFNIMSKENILKISKSLLNNCTTRKDLEDKLIWEYHKKNYRRILINLRPLFLVIDFESNKELNELLKSITFLKKHFSKKKKIPNLTINNCPVSHIRSKKLLEHFIEEEQYAPKKTKD